jgi:hypothetical protein
MHVECESKMLPLAAAAPCASGSLSLPLKLKACGLEAEMYNVSFYSASNECLSHQLYDDIYVHDFLLF